MFITQKNYTKRDGGRNIISNRKVCSHILLYPKCVVTLLGRTLSNYLPFIWFLLETRLLLRLLYSSTSSSIMLLSGALYELTLNVMV